MRSAKTPEEQSIYGKWARPTHQFAQPASFVQLSTPNHFTDLLFGTGPRGRFAVVLRFDSPLLDLVHTAAPWDPEP